MKEKIFVKPKDGKRVIDPVTGRALSPEGAHVEKTSYWMRRLAGGEVLLAEQKQNPTTVVKPKVETKKEKGGE